MSTALAKLLSKLPLPLLYLLFAPVAFFSLYYLSRYRRKVVANNIAQAMPELTAKQQDKLARDYYWHMANLVCEVIKTDSMSKQQYQQRVNFTNPEVLLAARETGRHVIILSQHQGNWEWLLAGCAACMENPVDVVYKELHDSAFDEFMRSARERMGNTPISHKVLFKELGKRKEPWVLAMLADQAPQRKTNKWWGTFFNRETPFQMGIELLSRRSKAVIVFASSQRVSRGYYDCTFTQLAEPPYKKDDHRILEAYASNMESAIRAQPETWLWSNNRWRYGKSDDPTLVEQPASKRPPETDNSGA
ncbi:Lipid A biosynthesis lauroyltransferase [Sinobacterium norvegicum]|uniref:Lipid A biosynthesis lauroyltransferase n=1 Tax=Sinobacterium norvegicum TaxID=1641715 RepID=A0ABM9ADK5_9GAMM|nr:lysophospholipid acyltransferase family protein [Sinobacterium norvegicum]CAH0991273.1 Lipid A biosynthesis lauroyltransferase [Sinobacterium norvegicum]